jgi:hypothetical protein
MIGLNASDAMLFIDSLFAFLSAEVVLTLRDQYGCLGLSATAGAVTVLSFYMGVSVGYTMHTRHTHLCLGLQSLLWYLTLWYGIARCHYLMGSWSDTMHFRHIDGYLTFMSFQSVRRCVNFIFFHYILRWVYGQLYFVMHGCHRVIMLGLRSIIFCDA